ncbi:MAG: tyrosine-type recombinase/integrase [Anaerolineae bacterium]|nr:tyrosine-type recombinase/integrase [Anaerolineae bacterium]MDW8172063.1 tyrosine-type recombinase/integrase [Anaerolineae bacterium]
MDHKRDTFDFSRAIAEHTRSSNTQRAYFRWVERYFVVYADWKSQTGSARRKRMKALKISSIQRHVRPNKLREWLDNLLAQGHSRQSLDQARAAIVTLAELAHEAGVIEADMLRQLKKTPVPKIKHKTEPERILSADELLLLQKAARDSASNDAQRIRNQVVMTILCTMLLRREELAMARWGDLGVADNKRVVLRLADGQVDVPRAVVSLLDRWRAAIAESDSEPLPASPLIRRIWKGGRVAKGGVSPDGIWMIVRDCALVAGLGHVTPDDLRRSVAALWLAQGMSLEDLSKALRHRNTLITSKFIARITEGQDKPNASMTESQGQDED